MFKFKVYTPYIYNDETYTYIKPYVKTINIFYLKHTG